jgi:ADP-ribose pyrophosphatase
VPGDARIATRRVYTGRVINLDVDTVRYPDGSQGELEMVRHPGASAVVPILGSDSARDPVVLLLRQYRYAAESYLYEIPAGRLQDAEDPLDCARRELAEETGYSADRFSPLVTFFTTPGFTDERIHAFVATGLTPGPARHETDEFIELVTKPMSELLGMIERGEINDAKSALSIMCAARLALRK